MATRKRSKHFGGDDDVVVLVRGLGSTVPEYPEKKETKRPKRRR